MDSFLKVLCGIGFTIGAFIVITEMREQNARIHLGEHVYDVCGTEATKSRATKLIKTPYAQTR